ncbi:aminotransferase-like domain-containing protein [Streptomyces zingiberis]|uniref:PLP-dependent aminotransferase family protein n=1 Tax=Streptomyces zingiberis TaxID=2053010 RepID=A0ABX1C1G0_9ACTN|nr:PLP-dependent aminotransferase family protein [Streptomyces zingiberis]NJQ03737.1 PLP-dependent aminotransferase family protein [Streptomyces zingiberis]
MDVLHDVPRSENPPAALRADTLHSSLGDASMESMNLLNEIADTYPTAVSFAAGRPYEGFYDVERLHDHLRVYCDHLRDDRGLTEREVARTLYQYGATKGIIADLVARSLAVDEGIETTPEAVVVTVGCQEALFLVARALRADDREAVLAPSPTYVGLTGAALLADLPVIPVRSHEAGIDLDDLVTRLRRARAAGRRVRAAYVTPDFANPVGVSMPVAARRRLLEIAAAEDLLLLEDNAYGLLGGASGRPPTLKSLDRHRRVVYLGSFAKTGLPGARVGYVVADQRVLPGGGPVPGSGAGGAGGDGDRAGGGPGTLLADELAKLKSMLTVNTSPVAQALIGGKLLAHGCSLAEANRRETEIYRGNLRQVLDGLGRRLGELPGVHWNTPAGGFFVVLTVPFTVDDDLLEYAARRHGVLFTPMHHFYGSTAGFHQLRLSVSALTPDRIEEGLDRLAALITACLPGAGSPVRRLPGGAA